MAVLPLIIAPDPFLNQASQPVEAITDEIKKLADDMLETMYANQGIGLAAVQVGQHKRMIVVDTEWASARYEAKGGKGSPKGNPMVLINPQIVEESESLESFNEGCLSFPDQYSEVERPANVVVEYLDLEGNPNKIRVSGLLGVCIQHEIDHINGIVFVDHISKLKREMILKKLNKQKKLGAIPVSPQPEGAPL